MTAPDPQLAAAALGALPMPTGPVRLSPEREAEIRERVRTRSAELTAWMNAHCPVPGQDVIERAEAVLVEDVPELLAENELLRRENTSLRARVVRDDVEYKESRAELDRFKLAWVSARYRSQAKVDAVVRLTADRKQLWTWLRGVEAELARVRGEQVTEWGVRVRPDAPVAPYASRAEAADVVDYLATRGTHSVAVTRTVHHSAWTEVAS